MWLPEGAAEGDLRAAPQRLWVTDCATMPAGQARTPYAAELTFQVNGPVNGAVAWFSAEMPEQRNSPMGPDCRPHTGANSCFPSPTRNLSRPAASLASDSTTCQPPHSVRTISGRLRVAGQPLEVHDTRRNPSAAWEPPWRAFTG